MAHRKGKTQKHKIHKWIRVLPLWTLTMKEWVAEETSRQYPSIKSAMFSAVVSDAVVTVRGYTHTRFGVRLGQRVASQ